MKRIRCQIEGCNSYIAYRHLALCRAHYAFLNCTLGWPRPSAYMDEESAKNVIDNKFKYKEGTRYE